MQQFHFYLFAQSAYVVARPKNLAKATHGDFTIHYMNDKRPTFGQCGDDSLPVVLAADNLIASKAASALRCSDYEISRTVRLVPKKRTNNDV
jgi:hypothetical protein